MTVPRETSFTTGLRRKNVWGELAPSRYKKRHGTICSRPSCERPRRKSGRYCRECTNEWRRVARAKARAEGGPR